MTVNDPTRSHATRREMTGWNGESGLPGEWSARNHRILERLAPRTHFRDQLDGEHGQGKDENNDGKWHESGFFVFFLPFFLDLLGGGLDVGSLGNGSCRCRRGAHGLGLSHFHRGLRERFDATRLKRGRRPSDRPGAPGTRSLRQRNGLRPHRRRFCRGCHRTGGRGGRLRGNRRGRSQRVRSFRQGNGLRPNGRRWRCCH